MHTLIPHSKKDFSIYIEKSVYLLGPQVVYKKNSYDTGNAQHQRYLQCERFINKSIDYLCINVGTINSIIDLPNLITIDNITLKY